MESGCEFKKRCRIAVSCCEFTGWYPGAGTFFLVNRTVVFDTMASFLLVFRVACTLVLQVLWLTYRRISVQVNIFKNFRV